MRNISAIKEEEQSPVEEYSFSTDPEKPPIEEYELHEIIDSLRVKKILYYKARQE